METPDDSLQHATVSDTACSLKSLGVPGKPAKAPDLAYGLENQDKSEKNLNDSAYSYSCRNSQSLESSKSTRFGSHSSGSSGYGQQKSVVGDKIVPLCAPSRKRVFEGPVSLECTPESEPKQKKMDDVDTAVCQTPSVSSDMNVQSEPRERIIFKVPKTQKPKMGRKKACIVPKTQKPKMGREKACINLQNFQIEFICVITLKDGIVMKTDPKFIPNLEFPMGRWIGRPFIELVHPQDQEVFTSQISDKLRSEKMVANAGADTGQTISLYQEFKMACRLIHCKNSDVGCVQEKLKDDMFYSPFLLKFSFRNIRLPADGLLIIKATLLNSAYQSPEEVMLKSVPFLIRHAASGALEHIDVESVPYLGYMPHELHNMNAMSLYHPEDLPELKITYEYIIKKGIWSKPVKSFRLRAQNGDYVVVTCAWTAVTDPWSMKLDFIMSKNTVIVGPATANVFQIPPYPQNGFLLPVMPKTAGANNTNNTKEDDILEIVGDMMLMNPAYTAKAQASEHSNNMNTLHKPMPTKEHGVDRQEGAIMLRNPAYTAKEQASEYYHNFPENKNLHKPMPTKGHGFDSHQGAFTRNVVMLRRRSPPRKNIDSTSMSSDTSEDGSHLMNYNAKLARYFDSNKSYVCGAPSHSHLPKTGDSAYVYHEEHKKRYTATAPAAPFEEFDRLSISRSHRIDYTNTLTQSAVKKHTADMRTRLINNSREFPCTKSSPAALHLELQNRKDHMARCNAAFQPTGAGTRNLLNQILAKLHELNPTDSNPATNKFDPLNPQPSTSKADPETFLPPTGVPPRLARLHHRRGAVTSSDWLYTDNTPDKLPRLPGLPPTYLPRLPAFSPLHPVPGPVMPNQPMVHQHWKRSHEVGTRDITPVDPSDQRKAPPVTSVKEAAPSVNKPEDDADTIVRRAFETWQRYVAVLNPVLPAQAVKSSDEEFGDIDVGGSDCSSFYSLVSGSASDNSNEPLQSLLERQKEAASSSYFYPIKPPKKVKKTFQPGPSDNQRRE